MKRWQDRLLQLIIFLIPSNLAYHFLVDQAYVNGRLIDYLIPKIYLSDILILILLGYWIVQPKTWKHFSKFIQKHIPTIALVASTLLVIALSITLALRPIAFAWSYLKIAQMFLLFIYLITSYSLEKFLKLSIVPLATAAVFQFILAITQYIRQSDIIGYYLLGEPDLGGISTVAKAQFLDSLKILPYGTTSHPNVLAGFLSLVAITLNSIYIYNPKHQHIKWLSIITTGLALIICILTQSFASFVILSSAIFLSYLYKYRISIHHNSLISSLLASSITITSMIVTIFIYHSFINYDSSSIYRRYKLNMVAYSQVLESPLLGKGINNTIPAMIHSGYIPTAPFIQPTHNIYLLWVAELGLVGLLLIAWMLIGFVKWPKNPFKRWYLSLPLASLLLISLVDHYPITLQTGQLLLVYSLVITTLNLKKN